jgi:hypothetical protein
MLPRTKSPRSNAWRNKSPTRSISPTRLSRYPYEAPPETHVVVILQVYTAVIVDCTPSDVMETTLRPS